MWLVCHPIWAMDRKSRYSEVCSWYPKNRRCLITGGSIVLRGRPCYHKREIVCFDFHFYNGLALAERIKAVGKNGYQKQVKEIYQFINDHLYFNRPDIEIKGERYNSTILFSLLTSLPKGKELIIGEPGLGKTTSAEYVCSLVYQFPLGVIWGSEVSGHPEQTEEKIIGRPDLGKLNRGEEEGVCTNFSQIPVKTVDEINGLPETKQSMILNGVDRGNWEYLNEILINDEYSLFATANYQHRGTNTIIAPLVDRFDVMVESRYPGAN